MKRLRFDHLHKGSVNAKEGKKVKSYKVYYTTIASTVSEIPCNSPTRHNGHTHLHITECPSEKRLVSYEGIITDTEASYSGIYTLDKKVKLVLSHLCLISNVQIFRRGQKLHITNAHLGQLGEKRKLLWACGKTLVRQGDEDCYSFDTSRQTKSGVHYKEDFAVFENDPVLNLCHQWNLTTIEVLYISDVYHKQYLVKFKDIVPDHLLHNKDYFSNVLKFAAIQKVNVDRCRCFITEFLSVPHECDLSCSNEENVRSRESESDMYTCLITVKDFHFLLQKKLDKERQEKKEKYSKCNFQYDYCEASGDVFSNQANDILSKEYNCIGLSFVTEHKCTPVLIGLLLVDSKTGYDSN